MRCHILIFVLLTHLCAFSLSFSVIFTFMYISFLFFGLSAFQLLLTLNLSFLLFASFLRVVPFLKNVPHAILPRNKKNKFFLVIFI